MFAHDGRVRVRAVPLALDQGMHAHMHTRSSTFSLLRPARHTAHTQHSHSAHATRSCCAPTPAPRPPQAHWPVPRMVGNLSVRHFMFNRTVSAMLAPYYDSSSTSHVRGQLVCTHAGANMASQDGAASSHFVAV